MIAKWNSKLTWGGGRTAVVYNLRNIQISAIKCTSLMSKYLGGYTSVIVNWVTVFWTYGFHWTALIISPVLVGLKFGQKAPKNRVFCIFWKCCHLIFLKTMQKEISYNSWLSIAILMPGKILGLELSTKMFLTSQIAGFCKV